MISSPAKPGSLAEAVQTGRMNRRAWLMTVMLVLFQVIAFADKAVLGLVAQQAIPELGISTVQFGFIGGAFFFLYAIASVFLGIWAGKVPIKWVLLAMGLSWAILQFPMLFGGGAAVLLVTRILLGGAEGPATAISLSSAHSWFRPADRSLPSNLIAIGSTLGPVVAAPPAGLRYRQFRLAVGLRRLGNLRACLDDSLVHIGSRWPVWRQASQVIQNGDPPRVDGPRIRNSCRYGGFPKRSRTRLR
jgi:MFS family permease